MTEPDDTCRPVVLPSGETVRVRAAAPMGPEEVSALGELVDAARRRMAAEHPPNPAAQALWARVSAVLDARGISLREAAREADVRFSTLFRIGQDILSDAADLAAIGNWLATQENPNA